MHFLVRPSALRRLPLVALALVLAPSFVRAQDVNAVIASMREDIRILDERTRSLTAEIEQLKRDNAALRSQASGSYATVAQLNNAIADVEKALRAGDREVALQLTQQLEKLAKQTQAAIDAVSKNAVSRPPPATMNFTDDYPKTGVTYVVQPGDSLASIAKKLNSSVRDIQNANKIADPRSLQAGQTLFIPQRP